MDLDSNMPSVIRFFSLCINFLKLIHVEACQYFFPFLASLFITIFHTVFHCMNVPRLVYLYQIEFQHWIIFHLWLWWIVLLWTFVYMYLRPCFQLGRFLGMEFLSLKVILCLTSWGNTKLFPIAGHHRMFLPAVCSDFDFSLPTLVVYFCGYSHSNRHELVSVCISLILVVLTVFSCAYWPFMSSLEKCLFKFLASF